SARAVPADVSRRRGVLDRRRPDGKPVETLCRREGQWQSLSGPRRGDGPHRQRHGRGADFAVRPDHARYSGSALVIGVAVLGSTGSIGESTLDVLARHPDRFRVVALAANKSASKLAQQIIQWKPDYAVLADESAVDELRERVARAGVTTRILAGEAGLIEVAALPEAPYVMAAIVGGAGLRSTFAAVRAGKRVLLANKESLVMAGPLLISAARASGATLLPVDSEHSAIFQCLPPNTRAGEKPPGVRRVLLTASGGPFLDWSLGALEACTPEQACAHPNWVMGRKISV